MTQLTREFHTPAQDRHEIWRIVLGAVLMIAIFGAGQVGMFVLLPLLTDIDGLASVDITPFGSKPIEILFIFSTFIPGLIGIMVILRVLHRRRFVTLFGPALRACVAQFKYGFFVACIMAVAGLILGFGQLILFPETAAAQRGPLLISDWLLFLLPMLGVIFIQIAVEELFFRGYLLQHLMARFGKFWIAAIVPSLIFGLGHYDSLTFGANAWLYVMTTTVGGILLCSVTLRTGNIGAALGLHFANNIWATLTLGVSGHMDGTSLWVLDMDLKGMDSAISFIVQTVLMVIAYLIWRRYTQHRLG